MNNNEFYEKLSRLQWLLHKAQIKDASEGSHSFDPTRGQGRILAMLKLKDKVSTKDLSFLLGIRVSSLNETLAKLEKSGYITREPSEADKRVMLVTLTEKGADQEEPKMPEFIDAFDVLSEDELVSFAEYLDRIITALEEKVGSFEPDAFRGDHTRSHFRDHEDHRKKHEGDEEHHNFRQGRRGPFDERHLPEEESNGGESDDNAN
jgi:DNA-binding MarR family transcriptional regulator